MKKRVLVACEESQAVTIEFRNKGIEAYSCDIVSCSGGHPEWHIKGDVVSLLNGNCVFTTCDGKQHTIPGKWDVIIAFPPCTHLAVSGARHFEKKREDGRQRFSVDFFGKILNADCEKIAVENPVNIISGDYIKRWFPDLAEKYGFPRKPSQIIQPYMFGHPVSKRTCLWLKNLPNLQPTNIVSEGDKDKYGFTIGGALRYATENGKILSWNDPKTGVIRSKTYKGIAEAMAEQWAPYF